ncbi:MAG: phenylalanine--tRNA ligase subunit beta [Thermoplasmatales archaeon]|nr:MAG: phenylalanine--tRNA ligase subunit beta [Thermoplasmatales archaeon]
MPLVTFGYTDFIDLLGYDISMEKLIEKLPMIGGDFDKVEGDELSIEFFPNRPDLTSVEGIARATRAFFGFETGLKKYTAKKSDISTAVDPSVKNVRPFVTTALIKNVTMTDELIASLMDMQEKLHFGLGRNRRKVAIGVHNFEPVKPPFTYKAVEPDSVQFIPLAKDEYMTLSEILERHEKGVDYAHLLKDVDRYPLIVDANNNVLSFPPIINGSLTEVTPFTKEIFIDVTGTDRKAINYALNIVVTALAERGSQIFSTTVYDDGKTYSSPDLNPIKKSLSVGYVNKILGISLKEKEIIGCLGKMGYNSFELGKGKIEVEIPSWRADILHEIDLVEDVAVGFGFDRFETAFPKALTFGETLPHHDLLQSLRSIMIGLGFNEVTTFTISNEKDEFSNMGLEIGNIVEIENPIGEEYSVLRISLLPSLLKLLRENRHHQLPQQIFEVGIVVDEHARNHYNLAGMKIDAKANFTESKSIVEALLRDIGLGFSIKEKDHPAFINGRCASIVKDKKEIGFFGELHPRTIQLFELEHPIIAFELKADLIH